jgi:uncharacterized membrane protein YfcA
MEPTSLALLCVAAFAAGLIDAVVGGGGLIQIPALFAVMPQAAAATVFGTNKLASVFGTAIAALRYSRRIAIPWRVALPAAGAAFALAYCGAMTVSLLPKEWLRPLVLLLLIVVAVYTFLRKDFGRVESRRLTGKRELAAALACGGAIGFYDGFFGPGTGSFLIFVFVRVFGYDFLRASSAAKVVNAATNVAALLYFAPHGEGIWRLGAAMALFNVGGAVVGTRLALAHGAVFVRRAFLAVAVVLIFKFALDTFT